jgi:hypothetical protein
MVVNASYVLYTNSMEQVLLSNLTAGLQWNPKFHYHVHKSPPLDIILSQLNPFHRISSTRIWMLYYHLYLGLPHPLRRKQDTSSETSKIHPTLTPMITRKYDIVFSRCENFKTLHPTNVCDNLMSNVHKVTRRKY